MNKKDELGVLIDQAPQDWQILQRGVADTASVRMSGRWCTPNPHEKAQVCVRVARESDGEPVSRALDWVRAKTRKNGTWQVELELPAGGLYRVETALQLDNGAAELGQRGDMIHHLGVGDVWLLTGQSNCEGHGKSPAPDAPELGVHVFRANGQWTLATHPLNDSTQTRYVPNRLSSNPSHSPWLVFAKTLQKELGVPIGLIPSSLGGSPISTWARRVDGVLFDNMLRYVADSGGGVRGAVWYQGESDREPAQRKVYARNFRWFLADLRKSLKCPNLPVITTQLNRWIGGTDPSSDDDWEEMRELQRQLTHSLKSLFIISTLDLGLSDSIHTNSLGNVAIGQRAAATALGGVYGRDVKFRHPECVSARRRGRRIELLFDHVDERLHFESLVPSHFPFRVEDGDGVVPVAGWSTPAPNRFEIELGRALTGNAIIVGAPGACPPMVVPVDISGHRPILAFRLPVEG